MEIPQRSTSEVWYRLLRCMTPWEGRMAIHIQRRDFIATLGGAAIAWPVVVNAQQPSVRRIGVLMARAADDPDGQEQAAALRRGLEELGWSLGRDLEIEYRWPAGNADLAQASAKEPVELRPDILV